MFIRTKTTPNSPRKSVQIVENNRDVKTGKVKQKIVRYVGIAMDAIEEEKLKALALEIIAKLKVGQEQTSAQLSLLPLAQEDEVATALIKKAGRKSKKQLEEILPISKVSLDMITEESRIIDGVHETCGYLYEMMGYHRILPNNKYNNILKDLVLTRISNPSSKLATSKLLQRYYMKEHELDTIYRVMDQVHGHIDTIQSITFDSTKRLMSKEGAEIILFDVTTLHFESTEVDELRKFGYSKNFRFNTTQVVLALATNSDGLPIGYELFSGNKAEVKTLLETIDGWKLKFNIEKVCFIGDRAMFSADNLKELEARKYHYIVAAKLRSLPEVMQQKLMQEDNYSASAVEDELSWVGEFIYHSDDLEKLKEAGAKPALIKKYCQTIEENKGRRFIVSYSSKRAGYDKRHRENLLEKISKQLNNTSNSAKLISNSAIRKYTSSTGKANSYIDENKIELDRIWDGFHGVITNIPDSNITTIPNDKDQTIAEQSEAKALADKSKTPAMQHKTEELEQNPNLQKGPEELDLEQNPNSPEKPSLPLQQSQDNKNKGTEINKAYILSQYRRLVKIEDCFRVNKTTLKMRPIYHFKPERIKAHIAICYMAFAMVRQLEYRVKLLKKLSITSIIAELNSVQSSIYIHKVTKDRYRVPGNFSNEARKIYNVLGLKRNLDAHPLI